MKNCISNLFQISEGMLHAERFTDFIRPYIKKLTSLTDGRQIGHIRKFIFTHLIVQSDLGIEYSEKYEAWKAVYTILTNIKEYLKNKNFL